jgi:hypothetical protein
MVDNDVTFECQRSISIKEIRIVDLSYCDFIGQSIIFSCKIQMISNIDVESKKIFRLRLVLLSNKKRVRRGDAKCGAIGRSIDFSVVKW